MKLISAFLFLLGIGAFLFSFTSRPDQDDLLATALESAQANYQQGVDAFLQSSAQYLSAARAFEQQALPAEKLQATHLQTREAFKRVEYLLEYLDHEAIKLSLNGAPLPSLVPKIPEIKIIEPSGLQLLDELMFLEDPAEVPEEILEQVGMLHEELTELLPYLGSTRLQHRFLFEAARQEIVRIFTLGLTGFDTPGGSAQAVRENEVALQAVYAGLKGYLPAIETRDEALADDLSMLFEEAIAYLQAHSDFETFDRLHFLKAYTNPLYEKLLEVHQALEIETIDEVQNRPQPFHYEATNLFGNDFLNVDYYANIPGAKTNEKRIELGRLLFFDPILSENNERACASCHNPQLAFTDGLDKSLAMNGEGKINRNAPTVINSVYAERYFYDLREPVLERQIKHVVLDPKEFSTDFLAIEKKLKQSETYRRLFAEAYAEYPNYQLSKWSLSDALARYISFLSGFNSPFDQYVRGERKAIEPAVARGFNLFMGKAACGTCHFAPSFNGLVPPFYAESESEVLGVPEKPDTLNPVLDPDLGRFASSRPQDEAYFYQHAFKTTTVRNVALTAPYMHNGVYQSLDEVVDFYNRGGGAGMGMDLPHQTLPPDPLGLSPEEMSDLVAFMEALTDTTGMTQVPTQLPSFEGHPEWNGRPIGGAY